ncbi:putative glycosyltransferase [Gaiella occulta]|uniref:Putative glycosyltransferase n=1 Tax=Gaiella occulta TaxID=1002870 RepID=A0A7M2YWI3_9ACTN|nr:glycosyltransferase family 2 protein [Gaiella occulta]RDI74254.1 putative glycosyltransferase [Gaiella occulta]
MADVAAVVVTYNALPWIEQCLASVEGTEAVVVDNGSGDGTVALVRERFPRVRLLEQPNRGLAAGWNAGLAATESRWVLILNADAWLVGDALAQLVAVGDAHPDVAVVGPKLLDRDGSLQRSVRGFPTRWRLATEYLYLRKLAPRSRLLNAFYAGGFDHESEREAEFVMGACMLVRRAAIDEVGPLDEGFFLFSEEVDWCYRFARAGWKTLFTPAASCVHVGGASHGGRLLRENVRGHLRFFAKHHGTDEAEKVRKLLRAALALRGRVVRGERGALYRDTARWLASGDVATLIER